MSPEAPEGGRYVKAAYYRVRASECRRIAEQTNVDHIRQGYLDLAQQWEDLARQAESL